LASEVNDGFDEDAYAADTQGETDPGRRDGGDGSEEDLALTEESGVYGMGDGVYAAKVLAHIDEADALTEKAAHVVVLVNVEGPGVEGREDLGVVRVERVDIAAGVVCCGKTLAVEWSGGRIEVLGKVCEYHDSKQAYST
jgi:hypothetical protein